MAIAIEKPDSLILARIESNDKGFTGIILIMNITLYINNVMLHHVNNVVLHPMNNVMLHPVNNVVP